MTEYSEGNDILAMWHLNFQMNHFHKSKVLLAGKCQEPNRKGCKVKPKVKETRRSVRRSEDLNLMKIKEIIYLNFLLHTHIHPLSITTYPWRRSQLRGGGAVFPQFMIEPKTELYDRTV